MSFGFRWTRPPSALAQQIDQVRANMGRAVLSLMTDLGAEMQSMMVIFAPWTDQTGNARKGLRAMARGNGDAVALTLYHSMEYGIYLELKNGGRYAVLIPVQQEYLPEVQLRLEMLFMGLGFS